jgi:hypothetical protein
MIFFGMKIYHHDISSEPCRSHVDLIMSFLWSHKNASIEIFYQKL